MYCASMLLLCKWFIVDRVIQKIEREQFFWTTVYMHAKTHCPNGVSLKRLSPNWFIASRSNGLLPKHLATNT